MGSLCFKKKHLLTIILAGILLPEIAVAQNCGCPEGVCYSNLAIAAPATTIAARAANLALVKRHSCFLVSPLKAFFDGIISQAGAKCPGKNFYTRKAFLGAVDSFGRFGRAGSEANSKREIAAFFAHATQVTGHFCYIEEIDGASRDYCDETNTTYPCVAGKKYFGRGPLQLKWNYWYGAAGRSLGFDGLSNPGIVASDAVVSFKAALWFWTTIDAQSIITSGQGFGATTRTINGLIECDGRNPEAVRNCAQFYADYCHQLGVAPGGNLTC